MAQKPDLRRQFDEWVEGRVQEIEDNGGYIRDKDVSHRGAEAVVSVQFTVNKTALDND
jgi:hypothetical protein